MTSQIVRDLSLRFSLRGCKLTDDYSKLLGNLRIDSETWKSKLVVTLGYLLYDNEKAIGVKVQGRKRGLLN